MVNTSGGVLWVLLGFILLSMKVKNTSESKGFDYLLKLGSRLPPMEKFFASLRENGTLRDTLETLPFAESLVRGALPFAGVRIPISQVFRSRKHFRQ